MQQTLQKLLLKYGVESTYNKHSGQIIFSPSDLKTVAEVLFKHAAEDKTLRAECEARIRLFRHPDGTIDDRSSLILFPTNYQAPDETRSIHFSPSTPTITFDTEYA